MPSDRYNCKRSSRLSAATCFENQQLLVFVGSLCRTGLGPDRQVEGPRVIEIVLVRARVRRPGRPTATGEKAAKKADFQQSRPGARAATGPTWAAS